MRAQIRRRDVLLAAPAVFGLGRMSVAHSGGVSGTPPVSPFDASATATSVLAGIDLSGKYALVTGVTSGIGRETMHALAGAGATVFGTGRTIERTEAACAAAPGSCVPVVLELSQFDSVVECARRVADMCDSLDVLICNAGVMGLPALTRAHGLEMHFVVNHLGHFILANRLRALVERAAQGRFVVVASNAYVWAPPEGIQFDNLAGDPANYDWKSAYGQSKLANGLFSRELARRLQATRATTASLHPGQVDTMLWRHESWYERLRKWLSGRPSMKTASQGAATSCYLASSPELAGVSGHYFEDCQAVIPGGRMEDDTLARELWEFSEDAASDYLV